MRLRPARLLLGLLVAGQGWLLLPADARAAEYTMETAARYDVLPADGRVDVSVAVQFTNTTPDPAGQFSLFGEVKLAVHDQAAEVGASDDAGDLAVSVAVDENGVNVATVELRDGIRFEESASFTLRYRLPDSEDPRMRVRPSLVVFPAWGFGTSSEVSVVLPAAYEVSVDGDPLAAEPDPAQTVLRSGAIADPAQWLSLVTATRQAGYTTLSAIVPLAGGTADLQVRAFADDPAWGERMLRLLERALPLLEQRIGLPYPRRGPLVVTEAALPRDAGVMAGSGTEGEILVAFDEPEFTGLHQAAHVWLTPDLIDARWIAEGLASHVAAAVAADLGVTAPYDPAAVASEPAAAAFPLDAWPSAPTTPDQERYAYAASWALCDALAATAGDGALQEVLRFVAAGLGPYDTPRGELTTGSALSPVPLTSRAFLDHLEQVAQTPLAERFAARVLTAEDVAQLEERATARQAHAMLLAAAGDWGTPTPVRTAMSEWRFAEAREWIAAAATWLEGRDRLLADVAEAGLFAPDRLRDSYREHGGGAEAQAEMEAEGAVVEAYGETSALANDERTLIERIGLLGGPQIDQRLNLANRRFADGDLRGATEAISEAQSILSTAGPTGAVRLLSAATVALLVLALAFVLVRRRRRAPEMRG